MFQSFMVNSNFLKNAYLTGFVEADGCFYISIEKAPVSDTKYGLRLIPVFYITQDQESKQVLFQAKQAFDCGSIITRVATPLRYAASSYFAHDKTLTYRINGVNSCKKIMPYFDAFPLIGEKLRNYRIFCFLVNYLFEKKHLTASGLATAIEIAYMMNTQGLARRKNKEE